MSAPWRMFFCRVSSNSHRYNIMCTANGLQGWDRVGKLSMCVGWLRVRADEMRNEISFVGRKMGSKNIWMGLKW